MVLQYHPLTNNLLLHQNIYLKLLNFLNMKYFDNTPIEKYLDRDVLQLCNEKHYRFISIN